MSNTEEFPSKESPSLKTLGSLITTSRFYAGIGSRSTPPPILALMENIASMLAALQKTLRSGAAPGADTAFERGCDLAGGKKEIFLPWKEFNEHPSPLFPPPKEAEILASFYHPNWRACRPAFRKFHARNCQQVHGEDLKSPVDFVLFWAPEENGKVRGGTATAVHLARETKIPTFNLRDEATRERWVRWKPFTSTKKGGFGPPCSSGSTGRRSGHEVRRVFDAGGGQPVQRPK